MNYKIKYQKGGFNYDSSSSSDSELDTLSSDEDYKTKQLKIPIIYFNFFINTFNKTYNSPSSILPVKQTLIPTTSVKKFEDITSILTSAIKDAPIDPKCIRTDADIQTAVNEWIADPITGTEKYCHISNWDTSRVTNMKDLFSGQINFNEDISKWNVSSVTNMENMFLEAISFNKSLNSWDVSKVTNMEGMFGYAHSFNQPLDTNTVIRDDGSTYQAWDVSSVTNMAGIFLVANNFNNGENAGLSNRPLSWDVSSVTDMISMFMRAESFNQPLNSWVVSSVTDMSSMFEDAYSFNQPLDLWDVSNIKNMKEMFRDANSFNQDIESWNVHVKASTIKQDMFLGSGLMMYPPSWYP